MKRRGTIPDYGWPEAEGDLATGVHPAVVAARMDESEDYVREIADQQGWPIAWDDGHPVEHVDLTDLDS